jgi:hypothetical protein
VIKQYITVTDETDCIRIDLVTTHLEGEGGHIELEDCDEIAVLHVTPYLTGPEARRIAERIAGLASVNLSDDRPIDWGTNY